MKRLVLIVVAAVGLWVGCTVTGLHRERIAAPPGSRPREVVMETTGYCACGACCGWKRNWYGRPVYAYGRLRGKPKRVGVTASGTTAQAGTLAADGTRYPFGTVMKVPGYGMGRVEDRGGAIQGNHIDLFFRTHQDALNWGRKNVVVTVWEARQ